MKKIDIPIYILNMYLLYLLENDIWKDPNIKYTDRTWITIKKNSVLFVRCWFCCYIIKKKIIINPIKNIYIFIQACNKYCYMLNNTIYLHIYLPSSGFYIFHCILYFVENIYKMWQKYDKLNQAFILSWIMMCLFFFLPSPIMYNYPLLYFLIYF